MDKEGRFSLIMSVKLQIKQKWHWFWSFICYKYNKGDTTKYSFNNNPLVGFSSTNVCMRYAQGRQLRGHSFGAPYLQYPILEKRSASSAVPLSSFLKVLQGFPPCPWFHCWEITHLLHLDAWGVLFHIECLEELVGSSLGHAAFQVIFHFHRRIELLRW